MSSNPNQLAVDPPDIWMKEGWAFGKTSLEMTHKRGLEHWTLMLQPMCVKEKLLPGEGHGQRKGREVTGHLGTAGL